ncbi:MAG: radical SAM protein [Candidatus Helarchaeota archaeon]
MTIRNQFIGLKTPVNTKDVLHPCYSELAHFKVFRLHLPVALKCNIKCRYCDRQIGAYYHSSRPGVAKQIISPIEALNLVDIYLSEKKYKDAVIGIAGPGEALFNEATFQTLKLVHNKYANAKLCICTNGLLLDKYAKHIFDLGVRYVTVTINAVTPAIGKNIYSYISYDKEIHKGYHGAKILIKNQLAGVKKSAKLGMLVKINSVLIPNINDFHLLEITKEMKKLGAYIYNIMPLIPLAELSHIPAPTCDLLRNVRNQCEDILPQFRLCKQCRADACSIPGLE